MNQGKAQKEQSNGQKKQLFMPRIKQNKKQLYNHTWLSGEQQTLCKHYQFNQKVLSHYIEKFGGEEVYVAEGRPKHLES